VAQHAGGRKSGEHVCPRWLTEGEQHPSSAKNRVPVNGDISAGKEGELGWRRRAELFYAPGHRDGYRKAYTASSPTSAN
jgi:hypothetical protein